MSRSFVALTGAGFSRPYGGLLASEVWEVLVSHFAGGAYPELRLALLDTYDFEEVVARFWNTANRAVLMAWILDAFTQMDHAIRQNHSFGAGERDFLSKFKGSGPDNKGYIFTLNQDMLLERKLVGLPVVRPGICENREAGTWFESRSRTDLVRLDLTTSYQEEHLSWNDLNYVKLHGSLDWHSSLEPSMVLGGGKLTKIQKLPVLLKYISQLEEVVNAGNVKLMVIGYGFMDCHINNLLERAVEESGLEIFIWNTLKPESCRDRMGDRLWRSVCGYCSRPMPEVLNDPYSVHRGIVNLFFSNDA